MNNKRGQFYIIAAVIILVVVAGIIGVKTYSNITPKPRSIESMNNELNEEGFRVVDYGIYNGKDLTWLLDNFTEKYAPYFLDKTNNANIIFLYGNETDLSAVKYEKANTGVVTANIGSGAISWNMHGEFVNRTKVTYNPVTKKVEVVIFNKPYNFDIKGNEMFYFVIVQEKDGEVYVKKS
jgi:hypothetical protein